MSNYTHHTAPTQFVESAGIRFAYRRFANRRFGAKIDTPLFFFTHFTGTMDHWDPALTDGFAQDREVILFNNAGIITQQFAIDRPDLVRKLILAGTGPAEVDSLQQL